MNAAQRKRLADQLREAVRMSPHTRREIAKAAGIHETTLSKFMSGDRGMSLDAIERLAEALRLRLVEKD